MNYECNKCQSKSASVYYKIDLSVMPILRTKEQDDTLKVKANFTICQNCLFGSFLVPGFIIRAADLLREDFRNFGV